MTTPTLTDTEREVITNTLRACRVDDGAPVALLKERDIPHATWMVSQAVELIVAARVADAVDRERAAWATKVAGAWDQGYRTGYSYRGPFGEGNGNPLPGNPYEEQS